jgi:transcriptional regulator GlxA family with amidase domain
MSRDVLGKLHRTGINCRSEQERTEDTFGALKAFRVYESPVPPSQQGGDQAHRAPNAFDGIGAAAEWSPCVDAANEFDVAPRTHATTHRLGPRKRLKLMVERAQEWIERNAADETLSVTRMACALNMSRTSLHRKFVLATGQAPGEFIRDVRLKLAHRLLSEGDCNVSQVAYAVGFVSLSGFSRAYRARYGAPPSHLLQQSDA